jgi:RNA polymerase sigma-70 factor (ECF subfamily)
MRAVEERRLLERVSEGDDVAFGLLARRLERPLYHFLLRVTGAPALAEDARQLTLVRIYTRAAGFRGGSVRTWIFRIAYRVGLNVRRDEARRRLAPLDAESPPVDAGPGPPARAERAEEHERVRCSLARLDEADRALLWLRVTEGLTFDEVAEILGAPPSTLRYRFTRALGRLRRELAPPLDCPTQGT